MKFPEPISDRQPRPADRHCFAISRHFVAPAITVSLEAKAAEALAELLPILCCGEEAAVVSFDRLGRCLALDHPAQAALRQIADDERQHDALLRSLRAALPASLQNTSADHSARQFHLNLARGGPVLHLARIAGLDAAVCTILSRLLRPGSPLACDKGVSTTLNHIRKDETRHVMVSRGIALAATERQAVRDAAAIARSALAEMLIGGADAFEALGTDPARLLREISQLPDGLLPQ
jgi:hypothetical protein